jgi:hypothetical protein
MAITVFGVDAVTGAPSYTGRMIRESLSVFSSGAASADPFACRSGVRPGTSTTTVTATSTTWTIGAHAGILDLQAAVEASGYPYAINAVGGLPTGAVTAANATYPRVDIVWLRIDDPAESDGSSVPAVVAGYTAGTAASSPVAPATPARCMVLANINVPQSGGGSPTVTWMAPYALAAGGRDAAVVAQVTTTVGGITNAGFVTLVTAPTVTADGVKRLKISASCQAMNSTVTGDAFTLTLWEDATQIRSGYAILPTGQSSSNAVNICVSRVPTAGAHVYKLTANRVGGTGTGNVVGVATDPIEIIVEQIA